MKIFFLIILLLGLFDAYAENVNYIATKKKLKTEFTSTTNRGNFKESSNKMEYIFEDSSLAWDKNGYYIELQKWANYEGDGRYIAFIPMESRIMTAFFIPMIPCKGGPQMGKCFDCIQKSIVKNKNILYDKCRKMVSISDDLYMLVKNFFTEKKKSLKDASDDLYFTVSGVPCYYNLYMLYQSKNGSRSYFDMIPSECIDEKMRTSAVIEEYIELYDFFDALFSANFKECRWDNFNNKQEIEEKCGKYNVYP